MNTTASENWKKELQSRFGGAVQFAAPQGGKFNLDDNQAVLILRGGADLFFAERREDGSLNFSLPLCRRLTQGVLIPPLPGDTAIHYYGRPIPGTELAFLPWSEAEERVGGEPQLWQAVLAFAAEINPEQAPQNPEELRRMITAWCANSARKLQAAEELTRNLVRNNETEQQRQQHRISGFFATLLNLKSKDDIPGDPTDPAAAAAAMTAAKSGIPDFVLARGKNLDQRIERSLKNQKVRITPAILAGKWYKESFRPTMVLSKDGKNAYCVFRNRHDDPVARCGATGKLYTISKQFRQEMDPVGWNFVIAFPDPPVTVSTLCRFYLRQFRPLLPALMILMLISALLGLSIPIANSMIFADVIPNADRSLLGQLFLMLLVTSAAMITVDMMCRKLILTAQVNAESTMQMALFDHIMRLPVNFFRKFSPAEMAVRVMGIHSLLGQLTISAVHEIFYFPFQLIPLGMLFYYSPSMALAVLAVLLPTGILLVVVTCLEIRFNYQQLEKQGEIDGVLERFLANIGKLHAAGAENHALLSWIQRFSQKQDIAVKIHKCDAVRGLIIGCLNWLIYCTMLGVILWMYQSADPANQISIGDFAGFISAAAIFANTILIALTSFCCILQTVPVFKWLQPLLTEPQEEQPSQNCADDEDDDDENINGGIELDNVSFAYVQDRLILDGVSIKARPGEFIAITGESGAGKSTLLRLMLRFEKPTSGTVLYDGEDADAKNMTRIRSRIGVVLQNASLMPDSILHNIIGTTSRFTEADAWRAAEMAGCAEDIRNFPMQMQTMLTGSTISGGQRQRILLAHALIRNPKLIFLDEATSALDNRTQQIIIESLRKIKATKVVIAHRLSTIVDADRIYVLEHGKIAEVGTYQELMAKQGVFAAMAARQILEAQGD